MITLQNISLSFGEQTVFDSISYNIDKSDRLGLVGLNGSGKSTLLKAIAGHMEVDSGVISIQKNCTIGYMPQEVVLHSNKSIFEETFSAFEEINTLLLREKKLEKNLDDERIKSACSIMIEQYARLQEELMHHDVEKAKIDTKKILAGLGFDDIEKPISSLSVGWKMRVVLAKLLLQKADFYLFDEPTNHLDIVAKDWFLQFLKTSSFGFVLVCHDRYFLENACKKIVEIEHGELTTYDGNYSVYEKQKEKNIGEREAAAERQKKDIERKMKTVERFRASASKAKMAQAMLKKIKKIEPIKVAQKSKTMSFSFPPVERSGKVVLTVENLSHNFDEKRVFSDVSFEIERGERVAIVAPNGVGKTTLFNIITGKLQKQFGEIRFGYRVFPAFFEQEQDKVLGAENTVLQEVESGCRDSETRALVRKFLGAFLFSGEEVDKKIRVLSGGEKNRVAMTKVLLQHANFLLLDEPTNHLDIQSKGILVNALKQYEGAMLFVSHDRDFLDKLSTRILELRSDGVTSYYGNYESYLYQKSEHSVDKQKVTKKVKVKNNKTEYEERKKINKLEKKIERLEQKIEALNKKLESFKYGTKDFELVYRQLLETQKTLEESMEEWEKSTH
jgi:ATP-binding cassette subfamily F protein 3